MQQDQLVARAVQMLAAYRRGETLQEIGDRYGITRERVRQILSRFGVKREHGGQSIRLFLDASEKIAKQRERITNREARCLRKWGMTLEQYRQHVAEYGSTGKAGSPLYRYIMQRKNAQRRGIEWRLSFADWWRIWQESGKWGSRGRSRGQYVMARYADSGPYSVDNIYICTCTENIRDGYLIDHPMRKASRGFQLRTYKTKGGPRWEVRLSAANDDGKRHFGGFDDRVAAEQFALSMVA